MNAGNTLFQNLTYIYRDIQKKKIFPSSKPNKRQNKSKVRKLHLKHITICIYIWKDTTQDIFAHTHEDTQTASAIMKGRYCPWQDVHDGRHVAEFEKLVSSDTLCRSCPQSSRVRKVKTEALGDHI